MFHWTDIFPQSKEMGNTGSSRRRHQRSHRNHPALPPQLSPQPEITANRYVFAAATAYTSAYPNPNQPYYYNYNGHYPPVPVLLSGSYTRLHRAGGAIPNWVGGHQPCGVAPPPPAPYVEHQKAITIRNDVNIKKETLRVEPDEENPGKFLVAFTFDATAAGRYILSPWWSVWLGGIHGKGKENLQLFRNFKFSYPLLSILEVELDIKSLMHTALKCMKCELWPIACRRNWYEIWFEY